MPNRKTVGNWGFNYLGLEFDEYGKVNLIYCKTCRKYYSNNEVALSLDLIKAQVDKFITGMDVIKKNNFSDHAKKSVSHLNTVNGLNQPLENLKPRSNLYCQLSEKNKSKIERPACYEIPTCSFYCNSW